MSTAHRVAGMLSSPLVLALVLAILFVQAYHPTWRRHLEADVIMRHMVVHEFAHAGSWSHISYTNHPAGAQIYFLLPVMLAGGFPVLFPTYSALFLLLSAFLLIAQYAVYRHWGPPGAALLCLCLLLAMGPLLLFRFEPAVVLLTVAAWLVFMHEKWMTAGLLLGLATTIKLFPVVLLPVMTAELLRRHSYRHMLRYITAYGLGLILAVIPIVLIGDSLGDTLAAFNTYREHPIGFDSLWTSILTVSGIVGGRAPLPIAAGAGGSGLDQRMSPLSPVLQDALPLLAAGLMTGIVLWQFRRQGYRHPVIPVVILSAFLLSSKIMHPQYLWWALAFLPLVPLHEQPARRAIPIVATSIASLVLTQVVYPMQWDTFTGWFTGQGADVAPVLISVARNLLLVVFFLTILRAAALEAKGGTAKGI